MEEPEDHEHMDDIDEADGIGRLMVTPKCSMLALKTVHLRVPVVGQLAKEDKRNMGHYKPKKHEEEDKCNGALSDYEDPDDQIFQLLRATSPNVVWREGLSYLMKGDDREHTLRTTLAFLHNNVAKGIYLINEGSGPGMSVYIDTSEAPQGMSCADWMKVLEGLGFELTSPGIAKNVDYVDVTIAERTDVEALKGFCCLMNSMRELSWTNLQSLLKLHTDDGQLLWETVTLLRNGAGIQAASRPRLEELEDEYPCFMKGLGFTRDTKNNDKLQWERSGDQLDKIHWTLHGLFRLTDVLESPA